MRFTALLTAALIAFLQMSFQKPIYAAAPENIILNIDFGEMTDISRLADYGIIKDNGSDMRIENGFLVFEPENDRDMFYFDISDYKNSKITVEFTQNIYIGNRNENRTCFGLNAADTSVFSRSFDNSTLFYSKGTQDGDVRFQGSFDNQKNGCDSLKCVNTKDMCFSEDGAYIDIQPEKCRHRIRDFKFVLDKNDYAAYYRVSEDEDYTIMGGEKHGYSADINPEPECYNGSCNKYKYSYLEYLPNRNNMTKLAWYGIDEGRVMLSRIKITAEPYGTFSAVPGAESIVFDFDDTFANGETAYLNDIPIPFTDRTENQKTLKAYLSPCTTDNEGNHSESVSVFENKEYKTGSRLVFSINSLTEPSYTLRVPAETVTEDGFITGKELIYTFSPQALLFGTVLCDFDSTFSSDIPPNLIAESGSLTLDENNNMVFSGKENDYFYLDLNGLGNDVLSVELETDGGSEPMIHAFPWDLPPIKHRHTVISL